MKISRFTDSQMMAMLKQAQAHQPSRLQWQINIRLVCDIFVISQTCYRYSAKLSTDNPLIADQLVRPTHNQRNWRFG